MQPDQALKPRFNVLLRDDKSFAYILIRHRAPPRAPSSASTAARGAPRATISAPSPRPGGQAHHQLAAEGVPAAHLLGQLLQGPHPALHAAPDQALLGALHRPDLAGARLCRNWSRRPAFLSGKSAPCEQAVRRHERGRRAIWTSNGRPLPRPHPRAVAPSRWSSPSILKASTRPTSSPCSATAARPASRSSSSAPARTGATAPTSRASTGPTGRRNPGRLHRPVLRGQAGPRLHAAPTRPHELELLEEALGSMKRGTQGRDRSSAQRGDKRELVEHALTNAREALGRRMAEELCAGQNARRVWPSLRSRQPPRAHRDLRQQPHPGHQCRRRHGRGRARGLPEVAVPQVQHQAARISTRATTTA
jgi:hypothetical protein